MRIDLVRRAATFAQYADKLRLFEKPQRAIFGIAIDAELQRGHVAEFNLARLQAFCQRPQQDGYV